MKKIIVTLITLFALSAFAQTAETVNKAPLNYLKALQSSNDAVVSSAIFYVVKLQMFYPDTRDYRITGQLITLANKSKNADIRKQAELALKYIQYPELMKQLEKKDYKDGAAFFALLSEKMPANPAEFVAAR